MWRGKAIEKMLNAIRTEPHSLELTPLAGHGTPTFGEEPWTEKKY